MIDELIDYSLGNDIDDIMASVVDDGCGNIQIKEIDNPHIISIQHNNKYQRQLPPKFGTFIQYKNSYMDKPITISIDDDDIESKIKDAMRESFDITASLWNEINKLSKI